MSLSTKNYTLYHSSASDIRTVMFLKKRKRLEKGLTDFNCFVVEVHNNYKEIEDFLKRLQKNIYELQDKTRFQLAVLEKFRGHWYLVDCYIKDDKLYTFCLDASGNSDDRIQTILYKYFPYGKHYYFVTDKGNIQYSRRDCQTFTREHAGLISNIDPDELYFTLERQAKYHTINLVQLAEIPIFTKLVRSIQSLRNFRNFKQTVKNTIVSSKGLTLEEWVNKNTENGQNVSILRKDHKYAHTLFASHHAQPPPHDKDRASGLVTFPVISKLLHKMEELSLLEIQEIVIEFISDLNQAPLYTHLFSFLHIPALHLYMVRQTVLNLKEINNLCESKEETGKSSVSKIRLIVHRFGDIITGLAGYLDSRHSQRTLSIVNQFLFKLNKKLYDAEDSITALKPA